MSNRNKIISIASIAVLILTIFITALSFYFVDLGRYKPIASPTGLSQFNKKDRQVVTDADYYVSVNGNDDNSGALAQPFKTIQNAQAVVRNRLAKNDLPDGGLKIAIMGGNYSVENLKFNSEDSGEEGKPITYTAYDNSPVIINGGTKLESKDFKNVVGEDKTRLNSEVADKIMYVDLANYGVSKDDYGKLYAVGAFNTADKYDGDHTGSYQTELFYNNERMDIARYPNKDKNLKVNKVIDIGDCYEPSPQDYRKEWLTQRNPRGGTLKLDSKTNKRMQKWKTTEDVWMFGYFYWDWADMSTTISNYNSEKATLTTTYCSRYGFKNNADYYFYNVYEELDAPGEYYLDRNSGKLYLYPGEERDQADILLSLSDKSLIEVEGDASYLNFDGLDVRGSRANGIEVNGDNCKITNCNIYNIAENGMVIRGKNNTVTACEVNTIGKNGLILGNSIINERGEDIRENGLVMENNIADNNAIHDYGEIQKTYTSGISISGVGNKASHNEIFNAPHMAIFYEGNEHIIEYNNIYEVVKQSSDAGAIYAGRNLSYYGNIIRYNCIADIGGKDFAPNGIYFDDGLAGQTAYGNILVNIPSYGFLIGGGRDNNVYNNLIINAKDGIEYDARTYEGYHENGWYKMHVLEPDALHWNLLKEAKRLNLKWGNRYPEIENTLGYENIQDLNSAINPNSKVEKNIILAKNGKIGVIADSSYKFGTINENFIYKLKDIGFKDYKNGNYELLNNELKDFVKIPYGEIGRY